jgi:hypothetical protein
MTGRGLLLVALFAAQVALAQEASAPGNESRLHSDFRREWEQLHPCAQAPTPCNATSFGNLVGIGQTLFTGQPIHIAAGSLSPQNGFGLGLAFGEEKHFANEWRTTIETDAVATPNQSWRAGAYLKAFRLEGGNIIVVNGPGKKQGPLFHTAPLLNVYAETTSLNTLYYYGLGPNTTTAGQTAFGLRETIAGASAIVPLGRAGLSFYGEFNGRLPQLRGSYDHSVPSIEQVYTEATAPGLASQPAFIEPGVGARLQPVLFKEHLRLHYFAEFQDFSALGNGAYTFRRWTTDLGHEFPLDTKVHLRAANDQAGPDSCSPDLNVPCPSATHVSTSLNHEGSIGIRLLMTGSAAYARAAVPFYFDPTIGGSDINGQPLLPSYPDYRFRGPNLVLLRETIEHSIPKIPLGVYFAADQSKVTLTRSDIDFSNLRDSYTVGLTLQAGGLPVVYLLFSWGGNEGSHTTFRVSDVLLGGSARPSLF